GRQQRPLASASLVRHRTGYQRGSPNRGVASGWASSLLSASLVYPSSQAHWPISSANTTPCTMAATISSSLAVYWHSVGQWARFHARLFSSRAATIRSTGLVKARVRTMSAFCTVGDPVFRLGRPRISHAPTGARSHAVAPWTLDAAADPRSHRL